MATVDWQAVTDAAIAAQASDIHLAVGQAVFFRCDGVMQMQDIVCTAELLQNFLAEMLSSAQREKLEREADLDFAWRYHERRFQAIYEIP